MQRSDVADMKVAHEDVQRVLLVEDYAANVLVATTYLEQLGYDFDVASNGMEAIEKARYVDYLAILMDVEMIGINGFETTQRIRAYEKEKGKSPVPIIAMTAHGLSGDKERCLNAGMDDYLAKPYNPHDLERTLARYANCVPVTAMA